MLTAAMYFGTQADILSHHMQFSLFGCIRHKIVQPDWLIAASWQSSLHMKSQFTTVMLLFALSVIIHLDLVYSVYFFFHSCENGC